MAIRRVVLVTGASSGIGRACAEKLAKTGAAVYGSSRDADFRPEGFEPLCLDVTDSCSVNSAVERILQREGRIDALVNNAGFGLAGSVEDTSIEEAEIQFQTNFFGAARVCKQVLPQMRRRGTGLIVNVSSLGGVFGLPFQGFYSASKFALEGLTESLRQEVMAFGVRVVLIEAGDIRTRITENRRVAAAAANSSYGPHFQKTLAAVEKQEKEGALPDAVADLICRLIDVPQPRLRYTVGHVDQRLSALLKRWIPGWLFERIIMSYYGVPSRLQE